MGRSCHNFGNHKQIFIENCLKLLSSLGDSFTHIVRDSFILELEFVELKVVDLELFTFRPFIVYFGEEKSICELVLKVKLVIFGYFGFRVFTEDIFSYLLEVSPEVLNEVFENMSLIGLEMKFQEHVMGYDNSQRYPIERTFLDSGLEQVRMVANLF